MTPYEVYKDYLALRNHFNQPGYDYFKYQGKSSGSVAAFEKRKDKLFFQKLAKHTDPHGLMLANFLVNPKTWIKDLAYSDDAQKVYETWLKRSQSLTYAIKNEVRKLDPEFNKNFLVENSEHPIALRLYITGDISIETLVVLIDITGCLGYWNRNMDGDVIWKDISMRLSKYKPFVKYDKERIKNVLVDMFSES